MDHANLICFVAEEECQNYVRIIELHFSSKVCSAYPCPRGQKKYVH